MVVGEPRVTQLSPCARRMIRITRSSTGDGLSLELVRVGDKGCSKRAVGAKETEEKRLGEKERIDTEPKSRPSTDRCLTRTRLDTTNQRIRSVERVAPLANPAAWIWLLTSTVDLFTNDEGGQL